MTIPLVQPLFTATQIGQLLRAARKRCGLTQSEVGARLGLSQNRVSHLEAHADELSVRQLLTWCAVVGLELGMSQRQSPSTDSRTAVQAPTPTSGPPDSVPEW